VRATTKIKSGEEITVSYVNLNLTRSERRMRLKRGWFFDCECIRCRNNDDKSLLEIKSFYDMAVMSDLTHDPEDGFMYTLKYCDLLEVLLGEYCINITLELVDLYINGLMFIRDRQRLDRIFKRAEKAVLVNYGHDYPLYEQLQKCKVTQYQNQEPPLMEMMKLMLE